MYDSVVGSGNLTPLEELKSLDQRIEQIQSLAGLQPLFARLEEITKEHSGDFEVQLVAHDVKQHMLTRGSRIKQLQPPPPIATPPPAPPAAEEQPAKPPRRRALLWVAAALLLAAAVAVGVSVMQDRNLKLAAETPADASITTTPSGANIQVDGQPACKSDCVTKLKPGNHAVTAELEGYQSATSQLTVTAGQPAKLNLPLTPLPVSVRIFADLGTGQVFLDDQLAGDLLDGQYTFDNVSEGQHSIRVAGGNSEAKFAFSVTPGSVPVAEGSISTKNLLAFLVANRADIARMSASQGPLKLTLNGQPEQDVFPGGIDLANFHAGPSEFTVGEGTAQRKLTNTFGSAPTLTVFLKGDQKVGTLIVTTGEDDVRIFVNNREQKRRTAKGEARLQTFGEVSVRVEKPGFEPVPAQSAKVSQGAETRMKFTLKAVPQFAALSISGAAPSTQILLDDRPLGTIGAEGTLRNTTISPGDHSIELRRDQYEPKRLTRTFRTGETVVIGVGEATLAAIKLPPAPVIAPPPAARPEPVAIKPTPVVRASGTMANFDSPDAWQQVQGVWRHRGAGTLTYSIAPDGIFTFSIYMLKGGSLLRGGRVRWFLNYTDAKNYALFELDEENFWAKVVENGKTLERKKVTHKLDKSMRVWNIQIDSNTQRLVHKIQGDTGWMDLDTWSEPGRDFTKGKFGILVNGTDEVGLSNFAFTGR